MESPTRTETLPGVDVSVSLERANLVGALLFPAIVAAALAPFWSVWGWDALRDGLMVFVKPWYFFPALLVLIVLHEALHGLGFLAFAGAPRSALHFGIDRATLSPYAGCRVPVTAAAYRGAIVLPGLALGVLPIALGLATGIGWITVWGTFMLAAAGGDLLVLWVIRGVPAARLVVDHPSRAGCVVLDSAR